MHTSADYVAGLDRAVAEAREALQKTNDEFLKTPWKLRPSRPSAAARG